MLAAGSLTAVSPAGASSQVPVIVTGTGFDASAANNEVTFVHVDGTVKSVLGEVVGAQNASTGQRTLTVRVPAGLLPGRVALKVRNLVTRQDSAGVSLEVLAIALPETRSAVPGSSGVPIRIAGSSNVVFVAGKTTVSFPGGTGITVTSTTVESATTLVATVNIASTAATGARNVQVKTSTQTALLPGGFEVTAQPPPPPVNHDPTASAGGPYSGVAGSAIAFSGSVADPDATDTLTATWDFGDGTSGSGASTTHVYAAAGSFTATLRVTDGRGGSATATAAVTISAPPPPNRPPVAVLVAPADAVVGDAVTLDGRGSSDPDQNPLAYSWAFGDGATTPAGPSSLTHAYASGGKLHRVADRHGRPRRFRYRDRRHQGRAP